MEAQIMHGIQYLNTIPSVDTRMLVLIKGIRIVMHTPDQSIVRLVPWTKLGMNGNPIIDKIDEMLDELPQSKRGNSK